MNQPGAPDPVYVQARRVLLDVLEALGPHREAVVLVGAQAVYEQVGEPPAALSPFTRDADLMLIPELLSDSPAIEQVLQAAGFRRKDQPGLWFDDAGARVDLLVPASLAGRGTRAADLGGGHDRLAAMRAVGLEAALVDRRQMDVTAFEPSDTRRFTIAVAGAAALLVAKLHKIADRQAADSDRLRNKDAYDLYLLLRATRSEQMALALRSLLTDAQIAPVVASALQHLAELFTSIDGRGLVLLRDSVAGLGGEDTIVASCRVLAEDLLSLGLQVDDHR